MAIQLRLLDPDLGPDRALDLGPDLDLDVAPDLSPGANKASIRSPGPHRRPAVPTAAVRRSGARRQRGRATQAPGAIAHAAPATAPGTLPGTLRPWVLDERTCEIGRHGVEQARRALAAAVARSAAA